MQFDSAHCKLWWAMPTLRKNSRLLLVTTPGTIVVDWFKPRNRVSLIILRINIQTWDRNPVSQPTGQKRILQTTTIPLNPPFGYAVPERSRRAGQAFKRGTFHPPTGGTKGKRGLGTFSSPPF